MTYMVQLDIHHGGDSAAAMSVQCSLDAETPLAALSRAEKMMNTQLSDDRYAAARRVFPAMQPAPVGATMAMAAA